MIRSMTAFARAEKTEGELGVSAEIRAVNSRYLDVNLRLPHNYLALEEKVKNLISAKLARGRVEIKVKVTDPSEAACAFEVDETKAASYHQALIRLREQFGIAAPVALEDLARVQGVIRPAEIEIDTDAHWPVIESCINMALDELNAMREKEGAFLARDFETRLKGIEDAIVEIDAASDGLPEHYQERLKERITALTRGLVEIDPGRIAQEAAFLADRSDISEEIVRSRSHIQQFRTIMAKEDSVGRKLNFLLQEFNREFNTMGSKTGNSDISHIIVALKSELEKIREQVQNVE
ncbi:YicC family protein [Desulfonema ishimotonii]|uniref:YicC family protein n=1 Tax=Desulfonema ishimotonii TaxID=45657 RepID=A0A401G3N1_9BACT|nr:YicC/YloC family endoribonuclease [Desulfonema ishimotonii]GBC63840.1 YicC family protein [Desulfonema ishimotonii]